MKGSQQLAKELLEQIYTTDTLKKISTTLESLSQNKSFKSHANDIIGDDSLTDDQKKNQLLYIIKSVEIPTLYDFFSNQLANHSFWLFSSGQIDYFDKFVIEFQKGTENVGVIYLTTAIDMSSADLKAISKNLSEHFSYQAVINHDVNSGILGGAQIRIENLIFDYSIRSKFRHFQKEWLKSISETEKSIGFHDDLS